MNLRLKLRGKIFAPSDERDEILSNIQDLLEVVRSLVAGDFPRCDQETSKRVQNTTKFRLRDHMSLTHSLPLKTSRGDMWIEDVSCPGSVTGAPVSSDPLVTQALGFLSPAH